MDDFLLEAMREVDAMLPDSPPITPTTWTLSRYEVMACQRAGVPLATYARHAMRNAVREQDWAGLANQYNAGQAGR